MNRFIINENNLSFCVLERHGVLHPAYNTHIQKILMIRAAKGHILDKLNQWRAHGVMNTNTKMQQLDPPPLPPPSPPSEPTAEPKEPKVVLTSDAVRPQAPSEATVTVSAPRGSAARGTEAVLLPVLVRAYIPPPVAVFIHCTCQARWKMILDEVRKS